MVYDAKDACKMLGIGRTKLDQLCKEHRIGFVQQRPGCKRVFTDKHIEAYLARYSRAARR